MRLQPGGEVVARDAEVPARAVARVDLRVHDVRRRQHDGQQVVHVGGEAAEAGLVAHKTVYVH